MCCEAGLCSVFLSVLTLPSPVSRGKASFTVWNPALVLTWDPVVSQTAFSFLPLFGAWGVPACSDSRHRTVIHWGRTAHVSPACLSWEWLPACPPTFCLPSLWARTQLLLHCLGLRGHLEPIPNTRRTSLPTNALAHSQKESFSCQVSRKWQATGF